MPENLTNDPVTFGGAAVNLPALIIVWFVTWILVKGIKEAAKTNNIIVIVKIAVVLFVIIVGAFSFIVMCWAAAENVLGPLIALEHFNGAKSWSFVISAESAGLIVGSLIAIKVKPKYPMRFLMISSFSITYLFFDLVGNSYILFVKILIF